GPGAALAERAMARPSTATTASSASPALRNASATVLLGTPKTSGWPLSVLSLLDMGPPRPLNRGARSRWQSARGPVASLRSCCGRGQRRRLSRAVHVEVVLPQHPGVGAYPHRGGQLDEVHQVLVLPEIEQRPGGRCRAPLVGVVVARSADMGH